jgi:small conductance mechanosensitive channel
MQSLNVFMADFATKSLEYAPKIITALLTWYIGYRLINSLGKLMSNLMNRKGMDRSVTPFLVSIIEVGLKVMLLLSVAGMFGIQTTSFIAIFTALVFAVGTALSGSLSHFASGVLLLIFRPYKVGDVVTLADQTGKVIEIQVFNTVLLTSDNRSVIIPNANITANIIVNSSGHRDIRVDMLFQVANDSDIDYVRSMIQQVANGCPQILKDPSIDIYVNQLPIGIIEMAVRPWCKNDDYWAVYFYMQENIKKTFDKKGIDFPKASMDINVRQEDLMLAKY